MANRIHQAANHAVSRITSLRVENYRILKNVTLDKLTPMTVLIGHNGCGKSTIVDVFSFLSECFHYGLRHAWHRRGRGRELKSRGADGPIVFELKFREQSTLPLVTYHLAIDEGSNGPFVVEEWLQWRREGREKPFRFLDFRHGAGKVVSGECPDAEGVQEDSNLRSPELIAVNTLGQLAKHPRVAALREFITDWYISSRSLDQTRSRPEAGPEERLSKNGDNLANVIQYLKEQHPDRLEKIFSILRQRIPRLERVDTKALEDSRLLLQIKDAPFYEPILSRFTSAGTIKMLAYLSLLEHPEPPRFIGIEEPENFLHPRLLPDLAEQCRAFAEQSQLLMTSYSPFLLNAMKPEEVRVLYRDEEGFTQAVRASDIRGIPEMIQAGGSLGYLWMEGHFELENPLVNLDVPKSADRGAM